MFSESNEISASKMMADKGVGAVSQLISTLSYLPYFAVLIYAVFLVLTGKFTAGGFFIAVGMIDRLSYPLISLADIVRQLIAAKPVCASMDAFLRESDEKTARRTLTSLQSQVEFDNVCFSYDGQTPILQNFSLNIREGQRYLFCGPSGCGKTTAVNLLLRYYDADSGEIRITWIKLKICCWKLRTEL